VAWIARDKDGTLVIYEDEPARDDDDLEWVCDSGVFVVVPRGTAEKLTGKPMSWDDLPRELK